MTRPKLLDLFCCAGGAARGYARAGFEVFGVDINPQPNYPYEMYQGDALVFLEKHGRDFDVIHASPPCQAYSQITKMHNPSSHPDLVRPTRDLLAGTGRPWIIENVVNAPLIDPVLLCGTMFGLELEDGELRRHRLFETSFDLAQLPHDKCGTKKTIGIYGNPGGSSRRDGRRFSLEQWRQVMDLPGLPAKSLAQAIPPAYTEYIGSQVKSQLGVRI